MHNLEIERLKINLTAGLSAVERQAELAAYMPRYNELANMAASAKSAWGELVTSPSASYAFAALVSLRKAIEKAPFAEETIAALHSQLGDWSGVGLSAKLFDQQERQQVYLLHGLDRRLVDLEPHTFEAMLVATDLRPATLPPLLLPYVSADLAGTVESEAEEQKEPPVEEHPAIITQDDKELTTVEVNEERKAVQGAEEREALEDAEERAAVEAYQHLWRFESQLRGFVARVLSEAAGPNWLKQRVPGDCLKTWRERQATDQAKTRVYELLSYADFGDWSKIIRRKDNWIHFETYFNRQVFVEESFNRLIPIRNDIAHMRPLTHGDRVVFYAEILQFSTAIGGPEGSTE